MNYQYTLNNSRSRVSRGLRNRRQTDSSWGDGHYNPSVSFSSQDSDRVYRPSTEIIREDEQQYASNIRFVHHGFHDLTKHSKHRIARSISVGITSILLLYLCYWSIVTGMGLTLSTLSCFTSHGVANKMKFDTIRDESRRRRSAIKEQLVKIKIEDRSLRGVTEKVGAMSHHKLNRKQPVVSKEEQANQMMKYEGENAKTNYPWQNIGKDATNEFFYAGKSIHQEMQPEAGSFIAYSYAILPFSDCNPFVISVWIYLSPESERDGVSTTSEGEDKPPRVILTTRTKQTGEGCLSDMFGGSISDPATGMILYAQPHFGDDGSNTGKTSYKITLDYAVANEKSCRTLVGSKTLLIHEGEWHHGELKQMSLKIFG